MKKYLMVIFVSIILLCSVTSSQNVFATDINYNDTNVYSVYDEEFNFISDIHVNQELFKIEYCPICGKRIIYEHKDDAQLKLKI